MPLVIMVLSSFHDYFLLITDKLALLVIGGITWAMLKNKSTNKEPMVV
jgi:hypothetical protein